MPASAPGVAQRRVVPRCGQRRLGLLDVLRHLLQPRRVARAHGGHLLRFRPAERPQHPPRDRVVAELDAVHRSRAHQDAGQRVIIGRRYRIELVVVAAGAAERQAHERLADGVDLLVHHVHAQFWLVSLGQHLGPDDQETGRGQEFVAFGLRGRAAADRRRVAP